MTLMLDLDPELESRLREEAGIRGLDVREFAVRLIAEHLPSAQPARQSLWNTLTPEEWRQQTRAWAASHRDWAVLPEGADDRASFYEGRE